MDELTANLRHLHEYRNACVLAITETWLNESRLPRQARLNQLASRCIERIATRTSRLSHAAVEFAFSLGTTGADKWW